MVFAASTQDGRLQQLHVRLPKAAGALNQAIKFPPAEVVLRLVHPEPALVAKVEINSVATCWRSCPRHDKGGVHASSVGSLFEKVTSRQLKGLFGMTIIGYSRPKGGWELRRTHLPPAGVSHEGL